MNLPNLTKIEDYGLYECSNLVSLTLPVLTTMGVAALSECSNIK
jgi:hypothetical protein